MNNFHNKLTKFYDNNIINNNVENKHKTVVPNTGEIGHYIKADAPHCPSTNMGSPIYMGCPNGLTMQSSKPCLLDFPDLYD